MRRVYVGLILLMAWGLAAMAWQNGGTEQSQTVPKFDPASQQTVTGTIIDVRDYHCPISGSLGTHVTLKSSDGQIEVHLAPSSFMKEYGISLKAGDRMKVTGTRTMFEGKDSMLARVVVIDRETFVFRNQKGNPLW